jgi:AAHS family 3-hydroxyphenylpropionic acid transporter
MFTPAARHKRTDKIAMNRQERVICLAVCVAAATCEGFDIQAAGLAAGGIKQALAPTAGQMGLFFAAANFGLMLGALTGGRLADRIGRKPVLMASILAFSVCSLLTAGAWDITTLTLMRFATGFGLGGAMPNLIALAADVSGRRSHNASISLAYVGMPLGGGTASLIALGLPASAWRMFFVIGGIAPLVLAAVIALLLKPPVGGPSSERQPGPISDLFADGRLARTFVLWVGSLAVALILHLILNWMPLLLQGKGVSKDVAAAAQVGFNLIGAGGALLAGIGLDTRWRPISIAGALVAVPLAVLALAQGPSAPGLITAAAAFLGAGILAQAVVLYGVAGDSYPQAIRGTGMGAVVGASRVGSLAGPSVAAALLSAGHTPTEVLTSLLPVVLTAAVCLVWLNWHLKAAPVATEPA